VNLAETATATAEVLVPHLDIQAPKQL